MSRFNPNFSLRSIAGESLLVRQGVEGIDMTKVVVLNDSGKFLFNHFQHKGFCIADIVNALTSEYEIDDPTARSDAENWINTLRSYNAIID